MKKWRKTGGVIIVCLLILFLACHSGVNRTALEKELQTRLESWAAERVFPGATLAVILPDGHLIHLAAGVADVDTRAPMPKSARIFSGSIGKTFAAVVALQLAADGRLNLDDKLSRYLGDSPWFHRLPNHKDLTLRMIMHHTGGLPRYILNEAFWQKRNARPDDLWNPEDLIAYVLDAEPVHPAGEGWAYSDTDYILLGMVIEKVTGHPYHVEVTRRVLEPLKLSDTKPSDSRVIPGLVSGYTGGNQPPFYLPERVLQEGRYVIHPQFEYTGGGLVTSSRDLARFARALFQEEILSPDMTARMIDGVDVGLPDTDFVGYGLGVQVWESEAGPLLGHGGIFPGYQSQMEYHPQLKCAAAMQVNADRTGHRLTRSPHEMLGEVWTILKEYVK